METTENKDNSAPVPPPPPPRRCRIVEYKLDGDDCAKINAWRTENFVTVGEVYPMMIIRVSDQYVSGAVFLDAFQDGAHLTYVVEASQGDEEGCWQWPV